MIREKENILLVDQYIEFLIVQRNLSKNSCFSYRTDLEQFLNFIGEKKLFYVDDSIVKKYDNWGEIFKEFEIKQKKNANAIQAMALDNYIEMRDGVLDPKFALKKELSFKLEKDFPTYFIPRYSMVMFHNEIPYSVSYQRGEIQKNILNELTINADNIDSIDYRSAEKVIKQELTPL